MENCGYFYIQIVLHMISLLGSIVAFYLLYQCNYCYMATSDASDVIITTLSILVTLLVGWNIYRALGIERRFKEAFSEQKQHDKEQKNDFEKLKCEIYSKIESMEALVSTQIDQQIEKRMNSAEKAFVSLFNTTQAQVAAAIKDEEYLQQYSHYLTALNALLQCDNFPSDIRININVILGEMEELMKMISTHGDEMNSRKYKLFDNDKDEFIQNMEEISKSSREEFSFEDRLKFMDIAVKARKIFDTYCKNKKV